MAQNRAQAAPGATKRRRTSQDATLACLGAQDEASFQRQVLQYAKLRGWHWYHDQATNAARRCSACGAVRRGPRNAAGWPDLVLIRRPDILFVELKAEDGVLSPGQLVWLDDLRACGQRVKVWRPSDWSEIEAALW